MRASALRRPRLEVTTLPVQAIAPKDLEPMVYTVPEVAQLLRCCEKTAWELIRSNQIPHKRLGKKRVVVSRKALEEFLDQPEVTWESSTQ